jgi:CubicO group peptidase (beta-lactamase class C family)
MKKTITITLTLIVLFSSCHVGRFFIYNFSDIRDYKKFAYRPLKPAPEPFYFKPKTNQTIQVNPKDKKGREPNFEEVLQKNGTVSFLVIRNDSIIYDWTRNTYDSASIIPSFSMAKSFVSALVGIAIGEGSIKSTAEPITNYLALPANKGFEKITIQHLLDMQSGIHFIENYYNPFGDVAKFYYGNHLRKYVKHLRIAKPPGSEFEYLSLNTELLAMIVEKASGKTCTAYLQEKLWTPIGMQFSASWSIDSKKGDMEKAFCCINARTIDFAKLGRLYLKKGEWNGQQLIPRSWVEASVYDSSDRNDFMYTNMWWHTRLYSEISDTVKIKTAYRIAYIKGNKDKPYVVSPAGDFFAQGHLGQFIYVYPKSNIVIVRLGKNEGKIYWPQLMRSIAIKNTL